MLNSKSTQQNHDINIEIETAYIAIVHVNDRNNTRQKCIDVCNILQSHKGYDIYTCRPFPGNSIHAYARFSSFLKVDTIFPIKEQILTKTIPNRKSASCGVILSLGETRRLGSSSLQFSGTHTKNAVKYYRDLEIELELSRKWNKNYENSDIPFIISGIDEIDAVLRLIRAHLSMYSLQDEYNGIIRGEIAALITEVKHWLDEVPRIPLVSGIEAMGYKGTKKNNEKLFECVCNKLKEISNYFEEALKAEAHLYNGKLDQSTIDDIQSLHHACKQVNDWDYWCLTNKRLTENDKEDVNPEGPSQTITDVILEYERSNEARIASIEATNRFLGGFSLPTLGVVFAMLINFTYYMEVHIFLVPAILLHFVATVLTFWLIKLTNSRGDNERKNKSDTLCPKRGEIENFSDYRQQLKFLGYEEEFYEQLNLAAPYNKDRVRKSPLGSDSLRRVTQSAWDLNRIKPRAKWIMYVYLATVVFYAITAAVYWFMSIPFR